MKKVTFKTNVHAGAEKVYETMLGLKDKKTYEYWTAAFNPTSSYEGSWEKGSKIYFVGLDKEGKKRGMVSEIMAHIAAKFISIRHYGFLDGEQEITTGDEVEKWAGSHENYHYEENQGITTVSIEIDVIEDYLDYFNNTYPKALEKLKEVAEK